MEFQLTSLIDGQYKVVEKHRGGMSIVYIVLDEFSHKRFAIKTVKEDLLEERSAVERFCEEAKTWMNIGRHQHVVEAIIYRDINGQPFLWLEYVDGTDLKRLIDTERSLFPPQVMEYALQVCEAMCYVHTAEVRGQKGVVHRDLKPANIMLDKRMGVKVTDFGLAKVYGQGREMTDVGVGLGTYLYMPPEQFLDAGSADATSDVFSFGASLYAALTGKAPVTGDTVGAVINSILSKLPPSPTELIPQVPPELSDVVMMCIAKARADRYPSFAALSEALKGIRPVVQDAAADMEIKHCQGCGYMTGYEYRVCPVCKASFDVARYETIAHPEPVQAPTSVERDRTTPAPQSIPGEAPAATPARELVAQAIQQREEGRLRQALALLREAMQREPEHTQARTLLDEIALELARQKPDAPQKAYNWPMFRGNVTRSGYTPELIAPPLRKRWQQRIGEWVISSPAVVNGTVFAGAFVDRPGRNGRVTALSARDGKAIWSVDFAHEIMSSPAIVNGRTLFVGCKNNLIALDAATGRRVWEFTTAGEVVCGPGGWRNMLFFGSCDGRVYAIHAISGQQVWAFRSQGEVISSPAYWNGTVYAGSSDHRLYAINAATGRLIWEYTSAGEVLGAPVYAEDRVFFGSTDHHVYCIDAPSGQKLWEYRTEGEIHASASLVGDNLYIGSRDHYIYCLDARTGSLNWRIPTGDWVHSSPLVSGTVVYCGSHDRQLYAIESESQTVVWQYETGGEVQSSAAASAGHVFVGSNDGCIYCFKGQ
ncbi:MAG: PQQ-binding-like beta-propeller repeat protein [Acidobacteriota bacterium]|nr:PQQ-binding-like beta-propeller repeat protein [Acidobacteriota bacterium]